MEIVVYSALAVMLLVISIFAILMKELIDIREELAAFKKDFLAHEKWLFDQLYAIAPGKVLLPDEKEEEIENKPATVYVPEDDPMSEFRGIKDDWHS